VLVHLSTAACTKNAWQVVNIPFHKFLYDDKGATIGGFAIESTQPGVDYFDDIELVATTTAHARG
jgi:hypothetical protein